MQLQMQVHCKQRLLLLTGWCMFLSCTQALKLLLFPPLCLLGIRPVPLPVLLAANCRVSLVGLIIQALFIGQVVLDHHGSNPQHLCNLRRGLALVHQISYLL